MTVRPAKGARKRTRVIAAPSGKDDSTGGRAPAAAPAVSMLRTAKGTRPQFYEDSAIDQLFAIATALTAEVSVAFDRIDTLERVLELSGALPVGSLESHRPNHDAAEQRARRREELLQRVFAVFESSGPQRAR